MRARHLRRGQEFYLIDRQRWHLTSLTPYEFVAHGVNDLRVAQRRDAFVCSHPVHPGREFFIPCDATVKILDDERPIP